MKLVEKNGQLWPDPGNPPFKPTDWTAFRSELMVDPTLNSAIAELRASGYHALSDAIVPAAMAGDVDQLVFAWNAAIQILFQTDWQPPDYQSWQLLADDCGIPIVFAATGEIAKK